MATIAAEAPKAKPTVSTDPSDLPPSYSDGDGFIPRNLKQFDDSELYAALIASTAAFATTDANVEDTKSNIDNFVSALTKIRILFADVQAEYRYVSRLTLKLSPALQEEFRRLVEQLEKIYEVRLFTT
jgi:hypothetical protein